MCIRDRVYSEWDKEYFPNPELYDEHSEEGWYILRANDLYAVSYTHLDVYKRQVLYFEIRFFDKPQNDNTNCMKDYNEINIVLKNFLNSLKELNRLGVTTNKKDFTSQIGEWLVSELFEGKLAESAVQPVSYTHLDVYKRQT